MTAPTDATTSTPDAETDEIRRLQLLELRRVRIILTVIVLAGLPVILFFAKDLVMPVILGLLIALTFSPVVRFFDRLGVPPAATAVALIVTMTVSMGIGVYALSAPVAEWVDDAPRMGREIERKLSGVIDSISQVKEASEQVEEITGQADDKEVERVAVETPSILNSAASYAARTMTTIAVALVLALFLLTSRDMFSAKLVESLPTLSDKKRALKIVNGVERSISRYLFTITLINAGLGVVTGLLMWMIGMPNPVIWGLVAFSFNYLPIIGALAGAALVAGVAVITYDTLGQAMLAPLLYWGATAVEGQFVTPTIVGRRLKLNTVSVFLTVVFWGWIWGIAGALLAVPFLVGIKVICDNVQSLRVVGHFLGSADTAIHDPDAPPARKAAT
ncbi:AI-2E family transporter [Palleronia caenipelagi]|uniref:AI-2E family transporter n=1 Tax=Palleronia caenipelagi TaxID=2489174 RepID=A0A547PXR4_9RHOB|nr:AI-2E family transporter [Palleronia caenipelagi]TRD18951.1 AI-2E family transporter [Palleronia caenipelagi]